MTYDFKKEFKRLYSPPAKPCIVDVPEMVFLMVDGRGDPNTSDEYANAVASLFSLSYALKMSKNGDDSPEGYFDYVVPPLEGLWSSGGEMISPPAGGKDSFVWTSMIRVPDFVTGEVFARFRDRLAAKKPGLDLSSVRLESFAEGLCAQIAHTGPYDEEPASLAALALFIEESGYRIRYYARSLHHEIYLGDPRKTAPEKLKTIIRRPVEAAG